MLLLRSRSIRNQALDEAGGGITTSGISALNKGASEGSAREREPSRERSQNNHDEEACSVPMMNTKKAAAAKQSPQLKSRCRPFCIPTRATQNLLAWSFTTTKPR